MSRSLLRYRRDGDSRVRGGPATRVSAASGSIRRELMPVPSTRSVFDDPLAAGRTVSARVVTAKIKIASPRVSVRLVLHYSRIIHITILFLIIGKIDLIPRRPGDYFENERALGCRRFGSLTRETRGAEAQIARTRGCLTYRRACARTRSHCYSRPATGNGSPPLCLETSDTPVSRRIPSQTRRRGRA